jgi:hypothetical protein
MRNPNRKKTDSVRFVTVYWHYRAKKWMVASHYGYKAWPIPVGKKKS